MIELLRSKQVHTKNLDLSDFAQMTDPHSNRVPLSPRFLDWIVAMFALLAGLATVTSFWNGEIFWEGANYVDPFAAYHGNATIRLLNQLALIVDASLFVVCVAWRFLRSRSVYFQGLFIALCLVGTALVWGELWFGSTFYYGEVRDKQNLPMGVNNGGIFGSFLFLGYLVCRAATLFASQRAAMVITIVGLPSLWGAHKLVVSLLQDSWKLWQS